MTAHRSTADVSGRTVVLAYGSVAAEYEALHSNAALFDRSHRGRVRLHGARAAEMVTGLVTNDVAGLIAGQGCYAAALTAKGKIIADVRVLVEEGGVLTDASPRAADAWAAMVKKFVNPRMAKHSDESLAMRTLGVFGVNARHIIAIMTGVQPTALTTLVPYSHITVAMNDHTVLVVRSPDLDVEGFELFVDAGQFDVVWESAIAHGAMPAGLEAWDIARVEAGRPEWGIDMDDTTIPQEANFDELHAISYTKGCYVGQETVARLHFRGHVNKHLRGIISADALPRGATLHGEDGTQLGDVRSTVQSPRLGSIGLAMVRREVEPGTTLIARWTSDGAIEERSVVMSALPFTMP